MVRSTARRRRDCVRDRAAGAGASRSARCLGGTPLGTTELVNILCSSDNHHLVVSFHPDALTSTVYMPAFRASRLLSTIHGPYRQRRTLPNGAVPGCNVNIVPLCENIPHKYWTGAHPPGDNQTKPSARSGWSNTMKHNNTDPYRRPPEDTQNRD